MPKGSGNSLFAVTAYFNPMGYKRRLVAYREFRKRLNVPLVCVELGYGNAYELSEDDAEVLVQIPGEHVLWQKERLLNRALEVLPRDCEYVAWLDCDIAFLRRDWAAATALELQRFPVVQPFVMIHHAPPQCFDPAQAQFARGTRSYNSFSLLMAQGVLPARVFSTSGCHQEFGYWPGAAWAARRDLVEEIGLYDTCILGGGDKAMAAAAYGRLDELTFGLDMSPGHARHYRAWARRFAHRVRGRVGFVEGELIHFWHGELPARKYATRYADFARFGFDPELDVTIDSAGAWRWNSTKWEMHRFVENYFRERQEDGEKRRGVSSA